MQQYFSCTVGNLSVHWQTVLQMSRRRANCRYALVVIHHVAHHSLRTSLRRNTVRNHFPALLFAASRKQLIPLFRKERKRGIFLGFGQKIFGIVNYVRFRPSPLELYGIKYYVFAGCLPFGFDHKHSGCRLAYRLAWRLWRGSPRRLPPRRTRQGGRQGDGPSGGLDQREWYGPPGSPLSPPPPPSPGTTRRVGSSAPSFGQLSSE